MLSKYYSHVYKYLDSDTVFFCEFVAQRCHDGNDFVCVVLMEMLC